MPESSLLSNTALIPLALTQREVVSVTLVIARHLHTRVFLNQIKVPNPSRTFDPNILASELFGGFSNKSREACRE